jgi:hypothetical protein
MPPLHASFMKLWSGAEISFPPGRKGERLRRYPAGEKLADALRRWR